MQAVCALNALRAQRETHFANELNIFGIIFQARNSHGSLCSTTMLFIEIRSNSFSFFVANERASECAQRTHTHISLRRNAECRRRRRRR